MKYRIVDAGPSYQIQRFVWYWPTWEILRNGFGVAALEFTSIEQARAYIYKLHLPEITVEFAL